MTDAKRKKRKQIDPPAPTPEEIAERCAAIRATWTEAMHRKRAGLPTTPPQYAVPEVTVVVDEPRQRAANSLVD